MFFEPNLDQRMFGFDLWIKFTDIETVGVTAYLRNILSSNHIPSVKENTLSILTDMHKQSPFSKPLILKRKSMAFSLYYCDKHVCLGISNETIISEEFEIEVRNFFLSLADV